MGVYAFILMDNIGSTSKKMSEYIKEFNMAEVKKRMCMNCTPDAHLEIHTDADRQACKHMTDRLNHSNYMCVCVCVCLCAH